MKFCVLFTPVVLLCCFFSCSETNNSATTKKQRNEDSLKIEALLNSFDEENSEQEKNAYMLLKIAENYNNPVKDRSIIVSKANAYKQLAMIFTNKGDYEKSLEMADKGLYLTEYANPKSPKMKAFLLNEKSDAFYWEKKMNEAEYYGDSCYKLVKSLIKAGKQFKNDERALFLDNYAQALVHRAKNMQDSVFQKALKLNQQAQKLAPQNENFQYNEAYDYQLIKQFPKAISIYQQIERKDSLEMKSEVFSQMLDNIGFCYTQLAQYPKAEVYFHRSLDSLLHGKKDFKTVKYKFYATELLKDYGDMWLDYYHYTKNETYLQNALEKYKQLDNLIDEMRATQAESSALFWRGSAHEMYENALETCFLLHNTEQAYHFMEKSRAVLLWEKLKANKVIDKNMPLISLSSVQQKLKKSEQNLVEYFEGKKTIYALTVKPNEITLKKCYENKINEFNETASTYLELCQLNEQETVMIGKPNFQEVYLNRIQTKFTKTANDLYQNLYASLPITANQIIISTDGQLLPFETLLNANDTDWQKHYLINQFTFSYANSATLYFGEYSDLAKTKKLLGIAPFAIKNSLENSDISLKIIHQDGYGGNDYVNEHATFDSFVNNTNDYEIVHFYSHAHGGEDASIRLYDKSLALKDIYNLKLKSKFIVLGACETGIGKVIKGEGVMSLARGFAYSGVPSTLTALWSVDNSYIYDLMELFYQNLSLGMNKDVALSKAKKELMIKNKSGELPLNIGSTVLIGQNTPILPDRTNYLKYSIILSILLLLSALVFYFIKRSKK